MNGVECQSCCLEETYNLSTDSKYNLSTDSESNFEYAV